MIWMNRLTELKEENENELIYFYNILCLDISINSPGVFSITKDYLYFLSKITSKIELLNQIILGFIDNEFKIIELHGNSEKKEGELDEDAILCLQDIIRHFANNNKIPSNTIVVNKQLSLELIQYNKKAFMKMLNISEDELNIFINEKFLDKKIN